MRLNALLIASLSILLPIATQANETWGCRNNPDPKNPFVGDIEIAGDKLLLYGDFTSKPSILHILPTEPGALVAIAYGKGMFTSIIFNRKTGRIKEIGQHINAVYEERSEGFCKLQKLSSRPPPATR